MKAWQLHLVLRELKKQRPEPVIPPELQRLVNRTPEQVEAEANADPLLRALRKSREDRRLRKERRRQRRAARKAK